MIVTHWFRPPVFVLLLHHPSQLLHAAWKMGAKLSCCEVPQAVDERGAEQPDAQQDFTNPGGQSPAPQKRRSSLLSAFGF